MDIEHKTRSELKAYFVKYAIPTESNFADLIDAMLVQADDGLAKQAGGPLCLEVAGSEDGAAGRDALHIYESFDDEGPAWALSLEAREAPSAKKSAGAGLLFRDGEGVSELFLARATGKVGLGTTAPDATLHIAAGSEVELGSGGHLLLGLSEEDNLVLGSNGLMARRNSGPSPLHLQSDGGDLRIHENLKESYRVVVQADGKVGIGTADPERTLTVAGTVLSTAGGFEFPDGTVQTTASRFTSSEDLELDCPLGLGTHAWLRHLSGPGENETLEIGTSENGRHPIALMASGNVGVGTADPRQALHVVGDYYGRGHVWLHAKEGDGESGTAYLQARDASGESDLALALRTQEAGAVVEALTLDPSGRVGIGVATPETPLHIQGGSDAEPDSGGYLTLGSREGKSLVLDDNEILARNQGAISPLHLQANGGDLFVHYKAEGATRVVVKHDGKVGIGTSRPGQRLTVAGIVASTAGGFQFPDGSVQTTASQPAKSEESAAQAAPTAALPFHEVQAGEEAIGTNNKGEKPKTVTITFEDPFSEAPMVIATPQSSRKQPDGFSVTVTDVTASSFSVNVYRNRHASNIWRHNLKLNWLAWTAK
ncbi:MAG: H-type lectin domain-containing protein [Acidobacteriota bacterium]